MPKAKNESVPHDFQVVCLLDVLGFESIQKDSGLATMQSKYDKLIDYVQKESSDGRLAIIGLPDGTVAAGFKTIESAYFSDTILFWTHYDPFIMQVFIPLMEDAICFSIESGLPLRGAMSVGELVLNKEKSMFLGEALVEAARTEREQMWIGISLGPSFQQQPYNHGFDVKTVMPYKSHYKNALSPYVTGMVVDWPRRWRDMRNYDVRPLIKTYDKNPDFSEYYRRTLAFVDFSELNHEWWTQKQSLAPG